MVVEEKGGGGEGEGGGRGWLINMPVKKSVVNCYHIIGKRDKFGGHS